MGHGQKNANRGEAIQRNKARVETLAGKLKEFGELMKKLNKEKEEEINLMVAEMDTMAGMMEQIRGHVDDIGTEVRDRLLLLERTIWRKIMDKIKDVTKRGDPAKPANRAIQLDIHSTRHEAHSRIVKVKKKEEEKQDAGSKTESGDS